jgi:hypothetical protein
MSRKAKKLQQRKRCCSFFALVSQGISLAQGIVHTKTTKKEEAPQPLLSVIKPL